MTHPLRFFAFAMLLLPPAAFRAHAQDICAPNPNRIIQAVCGQIIPTNEILQFEADSLRQYVAAHQMQESDIARIFQYGDTEMKGEIRGLMLRRIVQIVQSTNRNQHERYIYDWVGDLVWKMEKEQARVALADYTSWRNDPCRWNPNPDVAKAYGVKYDGAVFCGQGATLLSVFQIAPALPTQQYFFAQALMNSYGKRLATTPGGAMASTSAMLGILKASGVMAGRIGMHQTSNNFFRIFPHVARAIKRGYDVASKAVTATGVGAIVTVAVEIGIEGLFKSLDANEVQMGLARMQDAANLMTNTQPDLAAFAVDQAGIYKVQAAFVDATLPLFGAPNQPPARVNGDAKFLITPMGGSTLAPSDFIPYEDWSGLFWTVQTSGNWFARRAMAVSGEIPPYGLSPSIRILDWSGRRYLVTRVGPYFQLDKAEPEDSDIVCPADPLTGVSNPADPSKCRSYVARSFQSLYAGSRATIELTQGLSFTTSNTASFTNGTAKTVEIQAIGTPLPSISHAGGTLPAGVTFQGSSTAGAGKARLVFSGSATSGNYPVTLLASNGVASATQEFRVIVSSVLQFTSPDTATFTWGLPGSFTVTTTGSGPVSFHVRDSLLLPLGLSLSSAGDGTLTLSGTPIPGQGANGCLSPTPVLCVEASNAVSTISQQVKLNFQTAHISLTTSSASYWAGFPNPAELTVGYAPAPITIDAPCGLPNWLQIIDRGNGSATLYGVAPAGAPQNQMIYIRTVLTSLKNQPVNCATVQKNYVIYVSDIVTFTSDASRSVAVGNFNYFNVTTNIPAGNVRMDGALPNGITFTNGPNGIGQLALFPTKGTGGSYPLKFSVPGASQQFYLDVFEDPELIGYSTLNFIAGQRNEYRFLLSGYPKMANARLPYPKSLGMRITSEGQLPNGITLSSLNENGQNTGTPVLSGTPAPGSEGMYQFWVHADNGGALASMLITMFIVKQGDINADGGVSCVDVGILRAALGTRIYNTGYDIRSDINRDGVVDVRDLSLLSAKLPPGTRCQ